jgi:hypothetical protein
MQSNIIERRKEPNVVNRSIIVTCVVDDLAEKDKRILDMRKFCKEQRVNFQMRTFDSTKYSDDRDNIYRLPAFHITIKGNYNRTFYPNTRPYQHVLECIDIYNKRNISRKSKILEFFTGLKGLFARIFSKPTKIEKARDW